MTARPVYFIIIALLLLQAASAVTSRAPCISIFSYDSPPVEFNLSSYTGLEKYTWTSYGTEGVPIERLFWRAGKYPVKSITAGYKKIDWTEAAYHSLWYVPVLVTDNLDLKAWGYDLPAGPVFVETGYRPVYTIMDIAPTACEALGMPCENFDGKSLASLNASQVVVFYIDSLGLYRYMWADENKAVYNISSLGKPIAASSVYPSISVVNSAAMVTGVSPEKNGVDMWENRTILVKTDFDYAGESGIKALWIDGVKPPISMKEGIIRVPDGDGDGNADDEIMERAIQEYKNDTRLLYVHLKNTDRTMHLTGPYSERSLMAIQHADMLVGKFFEEIRPGTLVILLSDHGGHEIIGGMGDHGTLLPQDMLIPVFIKFY
ncbi:hypothetical protein CUJ83_05825 [Methanocella sp. CWC-04]|uniref:Type I phosphodiesterase / nucleotide pyrophosphatase n=1 Tax=Methanooceanicella nereidis TaxID=2052831 RepID=A0AAP2RBX3_9EURY|nr:alkaline phosphatase family protein [Methanocella sp. CWC-04]MCD1294518.1 hypothetical protein [Methanocella sp. CWC-04]